MRVKRGTIHIGRERFEAGAVLPDYISDAQLAQLEKAGLVQSDKPKKSKSYEPANDETKEDK